MEHRNHTHGRSARNGQVAVGIVIVLIGAILLLQREIDLDISHLLLPVLIIGLGVWLLVGKRKEPRESDMDGALGQQSSPGQRGVSGQHSSSYFNSTAIFSEQRKLVDADPLNGGEIVNIFGGTELNLLHSSLAEPVVIDIFQLFGGTKIIVPAHWNIHSDVVSIFGEVSDRRFHPDIPKDRQQHVYLKGTSIFGGITIKSK